MKALGHRKVEGSSKTGCCGDGGRVGGAGCIGGEGGEGEGGGDDGGPENKKTRHRTMKTEWFYCVCCVRVVC